MSNTLNSKCKLCHVLWRSDWHVLDDEQLSLLGSSVKGRSYRKGETIYEMGAPNAGIYCISGGSVGLRKSDAEGNSVLLQLCYPGETLGYRAFLTSSAHKTTAEALEASHICHVSRATLSRLLEASPNLGLEFVRRASHDLEQAHNSIVGRSVLSNRQRFAHLLLVFSHRYGQTFPDGSRTIELPLSRRDIASMIGTRHETLSRLISRLEADGLANFSGRRVHVPKIDALAMEVAPDAGDR